MPEVPATELDAVNTILTNMGEAPLNSLGGDLPLDALKAQGVLTEISRVVQTRGWFWNTEEHTLSPNQNNKIQLPSNALEIKGVNQPYYVYNREGFLYRVKRDDNGDTFTDPQLVEITYFLPFEYLPPSAKRYITARAARVFQARELGDDMLLRNDTLEEQAAWAELRAENVANAGLSLRKAASVRQVADRMGPVLER